MGHEITLSQKTLEVIKNVPTLNHAELIPTNRLVNYTFSTMVKLVLYCSKITWCGEFKGDNLGLKDCSKCKLI